MHLVHQGNPQGVAEAHQICSTALPGKRHHVQMARRLRLHSYMEEASCCNILMARSMLSSFICVADTKPHLLGGLSHACYVHPGMTHACHTSDVT
eukprot:6484454-Amphidinium_carterae.1